MESQRERGTGGRRDRKRKNLHSRARNSPGQTILARALTTAQLNTYFSPNHRTTTATPSPPQHTHQPHTKALYNTHSTRTTALYNTQFSSYHSATTAKVSRIPRTHAPENIVQHYHRYIQRVQKYCRYSQPTTTHTHQPHTTALPQRHPPRHGTMMHRYFQPNKNAAVVGGRPPQRLSNKVYNSRFIITKCIHNNFKHNKVKR